MNNSNLYFKTFLILLIAVSVAFIGILLPYYAAIFWSGILALIFAPLQRWLAAKWPNHRNLAALTSLMIITLIVILPVILITGSLLQEGSNLYRRLSTGELNLGNYFEQTMA